jgi:uncharacterized membrane protein YfcA
MLSASLFVALFAAFLAGCVSGLTGFGLALISVPLFLFVYEPTTVVALTAWLSVAINAAVVWDSWRDAQMRLVLALLPPAFLGIVAGVQVLRVVDAVYIRLGVGTVVVFSTLLLLREVRLPGAKTLWGPVVAGSASGALSTATGLAAPPIVILLASRGLPKHAFRSSSALFFLPMSLVGLAALALWGLMDAGHVTLAFALIPAAFLGKLVGTALLTRVSEKTFRRITLGFTLLTGALGVATALWALL